MKKDHVNKDPEKNTTKKKPSLKKLIVAVFAVAWIVPIIVFLFYFSNNFKKIYMEKSDSLMKNAVDVSGSLIITDLNYAITKMQQPICEREWEMLLYNRKLGLISDDAYLQKIRSLLISKYYMDEQIARYAFYLVTDDAAPSVYSGKAAYSFDSYLKKVAPEIEKYREEKSDMIEIHVIDNQIYLIRNLYTVYNYYNKKYGTIVIGLESAPLISDLPLDHIENVRLSFKGDKIFLTMPESEKYEGTLIDEDIYDLLAKDALNATENGIYTREGKTCNGYVYCGGNSDINMNLFYTLDRDELYPDIGRLNMLVYAIIIAMIPLVFITSRFLVRHVQRPLDRLREGADELREGKFGEVVDESSMPNREFDELTGSFNEMSGQIKYLFDTVYSEQMAAKEARIEALIAQINPHFLNNTLEMMNWQARMNNDIETSKMIEALGTVLNFSVNRENERHIRLSDELTCDDAYLYIMSMRFGKRLRIEKEIDETLLNVLVPQLIVQPLLENAVKHGIEKVSSGTIWLKAYTDNENIVIEVKNSAKKMSDEELFTIRRIISGESKVDTSKPGGHTSIGIYNVNKRINLIYGENYGLTVSQNEDGMFTSRLTFPAKYE